MFLRQLTAQDGCTSFGQMLVVRVDVAGGWFNPALNKFVKEEAQQFWSARRAARRSESGRVSWPSTHGRIQTAET
jgi:hypothetical protein